MTTATNAWVVCAPGDPSERQLRTIREMCANRLYTMTHYNERSGWIRFAIWNGDTEDRYSVSPDGRDAHFLGSVPC